MMYIWQFRTSGTCQLLDVTKGLTIGTGDTTTQNLRHFQVAANLPHCSHITLATNFNSISFGRANKPSTNESIRRTRWPKRYPTTTCILCRCSYQGVRCHIREAGGARCEEGTRSVTGLVFHRTTHRIDIRVRKEEANHETVT